MIESRLTDNKSSANDKLLGFIHSSTENAEGSNPTPGAKIFCDLGHESGSGRLIKNVDNNDGSYYGKSGLRNCEVRQVFSFIFQTIKVGPTKSCA